MSTTVGYIFAAWIIAIGVGYLIHCRKSRDVSKHGGKPSAISKREIGWAVFSVTLVVACFAILMAKEEESARQHLRHQVRHQVQTITRDEFILRVGDLEVQDPKDVVQDLLSLDVISTFHLEMRAPILIRVSSKVESGVEITFWVQQCVIHPEKFNVVRDPKSHSPFGTFRSEGLRQVIAQRVADEQK